MPIIYALFNEIGGEYVLSRAPAPHGAAASGRVPGQVGFPQRTGHLQLRRALPDVAGRLELARTVESYMARIKVALATLKDVPAPEDLKQNFQTIYTAEIAHMEGILKSGGVTLEGVQPTIAKNPPRVGLAQRSSWADEAQSLSPERSRLPR